MDQQKIGIFLKELRKEKQLTQEQVAEKFGVSNRTVSRWETGINLPDFDILIEIADFYEKDIKEILSGERKNTANPEKKENLFLIADYTNREKQNMSKLLRCLFLTGLLAMGAYLVFDGMEEYAFVCDFLLGAVTGILFIGVLYTTKYMAKLREFKLKLLSFVKKGGEK